MTNLEKLIGVLDTDLIKEAIEKYWNTQELDKFNINGDVYVLLEEREVEDLLLDQIENSDEIYNFISGCEKINFKLANIIDSYELARLYVEKYFSADELIMGDDEIEYEYLDKSEDKFIYIKS